MRTAISALILSLSISFSTYALNHKQETSLYAHMLEINENWSKVDVANYKNVVSFQTDIDRIQMHLLLVEKELLSRSTKHLSEAQKANRLKMLSVLHNYALDKTFPINTGHSVRQPYFIDNFGTHCAVGFLVKESGCGQVSKAISEKQNFVYVKEIVSPKLVKWSEDFGFTLEELAWIQPAYAPSTSYSQVEGGANGNVTCSKSFGNRLLVGGDFTELDSLPCLNVGYFSNNQLSCFGNGLAGKIVDIAEFGINGVIVAGEFESNGVIYPLAKYDGNTWSYIEIPNVPNASATAFECMFNGTDIKIAVHAPSISNGQEIWYFVGGWVKIAFVPGVVYDMDFSYSNVFAGHFDSIQMTAVNPNYWVQGKNFAVAYSGNWLTSTDWVPDTIYSILSQGNTLYFGGKAGTGINGTALMRFVNGVAQPLITNSSYPSTSPLIVKDIATYPNSNLIIGGNLKMYTSWNTIGQSLFTYDLMNSELTPASILDSTVHTIASFEGKYYFGGDFTKDIYSTVQNKNHLIVMDGYVGMKEETANLEYTISPNPSCGELHIKSNKLEKVEVLDALGKIHHVGSNSNLDLQHLPAGMYFVRVTDKSGKVGTKKWVKV